MGRTDSLRGWTLTDLQDTGFDSRGTMACRLMNGLLQWDGVHTLLAERKVGVSVTSEDSRCDPACCSPTWSPAPSQWPPSRLPVTSRSASAGSLRTQPLGKRGEHSVGFLNTTTKSGVCEELSRLGGGLARRLCQQPGSFMF